MFHKAHTFTLKSSGSPHCNSITYRSFDTVDPETNSVSYLSRLFEDYFKKSPSIIDQLEALAKLPPALLMYFFVEIEKMDKDGCFAFEGRQPGCLKTFFDSFGITLNHLNELTISENFVKKIHKHATPPKTITMPAKTITMPENNPGCFRSPGEEYLNLPITLTSVDGLLYLSKIMKCEPFTDLAIRDPIYLSKESQLTDAIRFFETLLEMLRHINIIKIGNQKEFYNLLEQFGFLNKQAFDIQILKNPIKNILQKISPNFYYDPSHSLIEILLPFFQSLQNQEKQSIVDEAINEFNDLIKICNNDLNDLQKNSYLRNLNLAPGTTEEKKVETFLENLHRLSSGGKLIGIKFIHHSFVEKAITDLINKFNQQITDIKNKNPKEKLTIICNFVQQALLIHPFDDANNRVFANALLNLLLLQHGFPFAIFYNPFVFYAHSLKEVIETVKLACANYLALQEYYLNHQNVFIFKDKYTESEEKELEEWVTNFKYFLKIAIERQQSQQQELTNSTSCHGK